MRAIRAWFDELVEMQRRRHCLGGCPIGALVGELAEVDEQARHTQQAAFKRWQQRLSDGLHAVQDQRSASMT